MMMPQYHITINLNINKGLLHLVTLCEANAISY